MCSDEIQNAKSMLEKKLREYGSVNLMADLVILEIHNHAAVFS